MSKKIFAALLFLGILTASAVAVGTFVQASADTANSNGSN
jgi:hypothetical protein